MKKRVLLLLASNKYSGAENVVCTIIQNLPESFDCAYCSPDGPIKDILNKKQIKFIPLAKMSVSCIKDVINTYKPDIIHANDYTATFLSSVFGKKYTIISHIHGTREVMNSRNIKSLLFYLLSKRMKHIIWVSKTTYDDYFYKDKVSYKSTVLNNIIDINEVKRKNNEYVYEGDFDLIYLGRLAEPKNPERMIEIVNIVKQKNNDIKVAVVGDGNKKEIIEQMIKDYHLEGNVTLFGFLENPYPILNKSKMLIMSSDKEGTPMVSLEAQMLGKPIISTPVDGLKNIVKNDYNGFLSDDINLLANKINDYLNPLVLKELSDNSKKWFINNNDVNEYINEIIKIYDLKG